MGYLAELHARDPNSFWSAVAGVIATALAILAYFRPGRSAEEGPTPASGGNAVVRARDISGQVVINTGSGQIAGVNQVNYGTEDTRNEWMVYEAAFLWHDLEPPGVEAHVQRMTRNIEETKGMLHDAIVSGTLRANREVRGPGGVTRWVTREALKAYAESIGTRPRFLFPDQR